jgi:branched-chain amino acid transport system substrate-binding protein
VIGWKPIQLVVLISSSVGGTLKPAGLAKTKRILSTSFVKDPTDPAWKDDPAYTEGSAFMDKYYPDGDKTSLQTTYAYAVAPALIAVLKQRSDNLTRENVMRQAASLKNLEVGMLLQDIRINTGPNEYGPNKQMQMMRVNGASWELFGP